MDNIDVLSPHNTQAMGLKAEGFIEAKHFWAGSAGKEIA